MHQGAKRKRGNVGLVVFDLNGVLLHHERHGEATPPGLAVGSVANRRAWLRPGAHDMLRGLLDDGFDVALWSTAKPEAMRALVALAVPKDVASRLVFAWDRR